MLEKIHRAVRLAGPAVGLRGLAIAWALTLLAFPAQGAGLKIVGQAAVLMEMRTGKILWQRNQNLSLAPASTTKIMTALVVLEHGKLTDMVTVPAGAVAAAGGTAQLQEGERLTVEQLLFAMMLGSANDAALSLATHVGGSVTKFVGMMNDKARSLGALQSSFRNPTGLPQNGHVTTARDLAVVTRAALENAALRKIVATQNRPWKSAAWQGSLQNSNVLLASYEGAIGVKTGQTKEAGFCLVAAARRGGETFVAVVLNGAEKSTWQDAINLLDYGFKNFSAMALIEPGKTVVTSRVDGKNVPIAAAKPAHYVGPAADGGAPRIQISLDELELPIAKGEKVGEAVFRSGEKEIARVDLISRIAVPRRLNIQWPLTAASAILAVLLFLWIRRHRRRHRHIFAGRGNRLKF